MTRGFLWAAGLLLALTTPGIVGAQSPWTVAVTPTMDPLPVGFCGAIHLTVFDGPGREVPRNPLGFRVTLADFDIAVSGGQGAVLARQIDASHWSACACQGAAVGSVATVVATYPARALAKSARVPGIAFQSTATFALSEAKGKGNPSGCVAGSGTTIASASGAGVPAAPPPPAPMTVTALNTTPTLPVIAPTSASSAATAAPSGEATLVPLTGQPVTTRTSAAPLATAVVTGPAPTGVTVTGNPAQAKVAWQPTPGVSGYSVARWKESDPTCCRAQSPALPASATSWDDLVQWTGTWIYRVTALSPNNAQGFADASYLYPEPEIPAGFTAVQTGEGTVALSWQPVPNASYYVVAGPPTNQAMRVNGASATVTGVPEGNQSWQVGSMYDPDGVHRAGSALASTSLNVLRRSGRYRLTVESLRVDQQTGDPDADGHGDEVYVSAYVQTLDRRTGLVQSATLRSVVHGEGAEYGAWAAPARVARGSASNMGGLKTGDVIPVVGQAQLGGSGWAEFVLWEGLLTDGMDQIIVAPLVWESDDQLPAFEAWRFAVAKAIPNLLSHQAVMTEAAAAGLNPVVGWVFIYPMPSKNMDRPLQAGWQWVVVLDREKIEASLAASSSFGGREPGVIAVTMTDVSYDPDDPQVVLGGRYTLYLRVVRLP
jgi:hypothetical protein